MSTSVTSQIDGVRQGLAIKTPVRTVATTNITLSGLQTINSVSLVADDRILVIAQTSAVNNGIYNVSSGAWTRAKDFDGNRDIVKGTLVSVEGGTGAPGSLYEVVTANPIVIGTSEIDFVQRYAAGTVTYDITPAETAAEVTPVNYSIPSHDVVGYVIVDRYGDNDTPGTTDMSAARDAAFLVALATGCAICGGGPYRVTSGYTNSTTSDLSIFGSTTGYGVAASNPMFILDSTDPASFFYSQTASNQLTLRNVKFACSQYVTDRAFIKTSASSVKHDFDNVNFVKCDRPVVWKAGTYFQMMRYRGIRFTNSGSFHSEVTDDLIATLMEVASVDVEGTIPANTSKIAMGLTGIREIRGLNVLIEPNVPSSGWVAIAIDDAAEASWTRSPVASFDGLHIEGTGSGFIYSMDVKGGRVIVQNPVLNNGANAPIRLRDSAAVEIIVASFSATGDALENYFSLEDASCQVILAGCNVRNLGTTVTDPRFTLSNCSLSPGGGAGTEVYRDTNFDNSLSKLLWRFDGGFVDPGMCVLTLSGGTTYTPTTDATYGRALSVIRSGGTIDARFEARVRSVLPAGSQFFIVLRATMPTLSSGTSTVNLTVDGAAIGPGATYTSGQTALFVLPAALATANPATLGVSFGAATATGDLTIQQLEIWIGKSVPNLLIPNYLQNVQTWNSAAPTAGTWVRGDITWNNTPSSGGPPGWMCATGGSPGTWQAMANLA